MSDFDQNRTDNYNKFFQYVEANMLVKEDKNEANMMKHVMSEMKEDLNKYYKIKKTIDE